MQLATDRADLQSRLVDYASRIGEFRTPSEVLDALHSAVSQSLPLSVLGAAQFPIRGSDWCALELGKSVFLHKEVPGGWWQEHESLVRGQFRPVLFVARTSLASHTWTELRRLLEPIGTDRWPYELALKYGMRDGLTCPIGGRWVVVFWSRKVLSQVLTQLSRMMLLAAANFAALRLEQLVGSDAHRLASCARLTSREIAILRLVSTGRRTGDIARLLGIGEETVRSHLKKVQAKLVVRNRTHAACEALRYGLIP